MSNHQTPLILIVDDDAFQRKLIRTILEESEFLCDEAVDGEAGLRKSLELRPGLVILDVLMPQRDGFSVCSELRRNPESEGLPILMVTGLDDTRSIERAFEAGATNFLTKPINPLLLAHHVRYMLRAGEIERQTREAKQIAEVSSASKSEFLANMSHELRTPLNAIIGFSELMHSKVLSPEDPRFFEYAGDIYHSARHLLDIINDVLDASAIDAGKLVLNESLESVSDLVDRTIRMVRPRAEQAGVTIEIGLGQDLPFLRIDGLRMKQVLINLVSNAVKFTPKGGQVEIRAFETPDRGLTIAVEDTGIGIPEDQIDVALALFGQVDGGLNRTFEGTGLGLPLAKRLTHLIGGQFDLQSQVGSGTTVTLSFPKAVLCRDVAPALATRIG